MSTGFRCWRLFRVDPCLSNLRALTDFQSYVLVIERGGSWAQMSIWELSRT